MTKLKLLLKKYKILLIIIIGVTISYSLINCSALLLNINKNPQNDSNLPLKNAIVYDLPITYDIQDTTINDHILIRGAATVNIINSTVVGRIDVLDYGKLFINTNSNITENVICSGFSSVIIDNSTIGGEIDGYSYSNLTLSFCQTPSTSLWKGDSANLTIINSSLAELYDIGTAGDIIITNSSITAVMLYGASRTYINNSTITIFNDLAIPFNIITGPIGGYYQAILSRLDLPGIRYQTSENAINLTWIGWDNPVIDGFMNVTFQIFLDQQLYEEINGSGFYNSYTGSLVINIPTPGEHNISVITIDNFGNNYTSSITIEIVVYPEFQWTFLWIGASIAAIAIFIPVMLLRYRQKRGYYSSIGTIFKKELTDSKVKILIFMAISAAPGIILALVFGAIKHISGTLGIDMIRTIINTILSFFYLYFGMAFAIVFTATSIINSKRNGSLSWFLSKPARRWEILWGKTLAFLLIIILVSISSAISIGLSGIFFVGQAHISDILSIGGFVFIIGLITLVPVLGIGMLLTSISKKSGLAIFIPILIFMVMPTFISFLPLFIRNEWPLLFSYSYYGEQLGIAWISQTGGGLSSLTSSVTQLVDFNIVTLNLPAIGICIILIIVSVVCLVMATFVLNKIDIS